MRSGAESAPQQGGKSFPGGPSAPAGAVTALPQKSEGNKLAEVSQKESQLIKYEGQWAATTAAGTVSIFFSSFLSLSVLPLSVSASRTVGGGGLLPFPKIATVSYSRPY